MRRFLKSAGILTVANLLERGIPLFLLPILTRLLSTADYGAITTINALRNTIEPVIVMSVSAAVGRAYFDRSRNDFDFQAYIYNAVLVSSLLFAGVLVVLLGLQSAFSALRAFGWGWLFLVTCYVWAGAAGGIKVNLWIYQQRPLAYSIYSVTKALSNLGLSLLIIFFWLRNWKGRVLGVGATEILFGVISLFFLVRQDGFRTRLNYGYIRDLLKFGLPLLPHSFGLIALSTADKFFLNSMLGLSVTGLYGVGYTLGAVLVIFTTPIEKALEPVIYGYLSDLDAHKAVKIVQISYAFILGVAGAALVLSLMAPVALRLFVAENFYPAQDFVPWIAFGFAAFSMRRFFTMFITYSKKTYWMTATTLFAGLVAVAANYLLIRANGAIGAAQAVCISFGVYWLSSWVVVARLYSLPWWRVFRPATRS